jgi:hypothetical protein
MPKVRKNDSQGEKWHVFRTTQKVRIVFVYVEFHEESSINIDSQLKISSIETNMPIFNKQW